MYPPKEDFHFPLLGNRKMPWTSNHFKLNFCLWVYRAVCILWIHCSDQNEMELVVTKSQGRFFFLMPLRATGKTNQFFPLLPFAEQIIQPLLYVLRLLHLRSLGHLLGSLICSPTFLRCQALSLVHYTYGPLKPSLTFRG